MHAIESSPFSEHLQRLGKQLPEPRAILCISAHWTTEGTWLTHMPYPRTIHDFGGFPAELFAVQYPAPGAPELAESVQRLVPFVRLDDSEWGFDHGSWALLCHMYPAAHIPVIQLSLDLAQPSRYHYALGESLRRLREEGVLIIGSGNIVHNLRRARFDATMPPYDWAVTFDTWVKEKLIARDWDALLDHAMDSAEGKLSIPTSEHWLPLLYILGASDTSDALQFTFEGMELGSISQRSLQFG